MHFSSFLTTILPQFFHPATLLLSPTFPKTSPFPSLSAKYDRGPTPSADCGVAWAAREMGTGRLAVCLSLLLRSLLLILKMPLQPARRRCCRVLCAAAGPVCPPQRHLSPVRGVFDFEPLLCSGGLAAAQRIVATSRALANFLSTRSCHTGQPPPFCPAGAHDILRTTQRAMANDEAPMENASLRVN